MEMFEPRDLPWQAGPYPFRSPSRRPRSHQLIGLAAVTEVLYTKTVIDLLPEEAELRQTDSSAGNRSFGTAPVLGVI